MADDEDFGAFMPGPRVVRDATGSGALDGLRFAVKDLIDIGGALTSGGNPDWAASHGPASSDAPAVARLRAAGATIVGKTVTDELAFSLEGENVHYGTPRNPSAPGRLPGGSSSGSAVAVAAGLADFALGTDTGGSVRVPASFCGLFGMRPSHGRIPLEGVLPFAPSYDTVGWFARDAITLAHVSAALLDRPRPAIPLQLHIVDDAFDAIPPACAQALLRHARALGARSSVRVFDDAIGDWLNAYQVLQGSEIRDSLGAWIAARQPRFGANIAPRFAGLMHLDAAQRARWAEWRQMQRTRIAAMLPPGHAWLMPTAPCPALSPHAPPEERAQFYSVALALCAVAGHCGLPQLTLPLGKMSGLPLGLSIVGAPGSDESLMAYAMDIH